MAISAVLQVHASDSKASLSTDSETKIKAKPRIERNRVLVTGGAGFVGSHLCTYLVERGDHVRTPCFPLLCLLALKRSLLGRANACARTVGR